MSERPSGGQRPATRALAALTVALAVGLWALDLRAVALAPSDRELARRVAADAGSPAARRALYALVAREVARSARLPELDAALAALGPQERAFLAAYRPDLLRRGDGR